MHRCRLLVAYGLLTLPAFCQLVQANEQLDHADAGFVQVASPEPEEEAATSRPGMFGLAVGYVDDAQRLASERFGNFMAQVDGFFGDGSSNEDAVSNRSWARIRLDADKPGGEDIDVGPSFKLRAILPQTERRLKLLFSTEDDESELAGENVERLQAAGSGGDQNASLAIRFIRTARDSGGLSFDLGIRQRDSKVQLFTRVNTRFKGRLLKLWLVSVSNSYYYFSKSGFENKLALDFRRPLFFRDDFFFRSNTQFNWRNRQKGSIIAQTLGVYKQFGPRKSFALEALAGYHTALNADVDDRFRGHEFRIRWRHNIWRPWFFYEIWPAVSWSANNDYERAYGALLRVEVVIGQQ